MALKVRSRPILGGLSLVQGSLILISARLVLVLAGAVPALVLGLSRVAQGPARQPYFTDVQGPLPLVHMGRLLSHLVLPLAWTLVLAAVLVCLGHQILVAGAVSWLDPARSREGKRGVLGAVLKDGTGYLWTMLRVVLLSAVLDGCGLMLINWAAARLSAAGDRAGSSGLSLWVVIPALETLAVLLWLSVVGAGALWCRLVLVADGRRIVRSASLMVLRVFWRQPWRAPLLYVGLTLLGWAAGTAVLAGWRQAAPGTVAGALLWFGAWILVLALQSWIWHWLVRSGRLLWAEFEDLRRRPDGPWGLLDRLRRRRGLRSQALSPPSPPSPPPAG